MTRSIETLGTLQNRFQARTSEPDAKDAATQLEAFFLRQMLTEMRGSMGDSMFGGGYAGKMFQDMLDDTMAEQMSTAGGLGLANMLESELDEQSFLDKTPMAAAPARAMPSAAHALGRYQEVNSSLQAMPVDAPISSSFGKRIHPVTGQHSFHEGLDLAATQGSQVSATSAGVVIRAEAAGSYGNLVVVDHGGGLETRYAHLQDIDVQVGQQVAAGAPLGTVGSTGRATGPHLHFEVRRGGKALNPAHELENLQKNADISQDAPHAAER